MYTLFSASDTTDIHEDDTKPNKSSDTVNLAGGSDYLVPINNTSSPAEHQSPVSVEASTLGTDLDLGSLVEVDMPGCKHHLYGVVRWMGILRDREKPFVGVELVIINTILYEYQVILIAYYLF